MRSCSQRNPSKCVNKQPLRRSPRQGWAAPVSHLRPEPSLPIQPPAHHPPRPSLPQWFLEQHQMELGEDAEVKTAATLAQQMAYQNKVRRRGRGKSGSVLES